ncbi:MAG: pilus assembly protein [Actinomycetota bacterium]|nr:pilus assembly protein [Actinomycetota bacterium]
MSLFGLRRREETGAAIVEFSLVVGLFVFLLYGIIAFGMAIGVKQNVTHAAFAGARAAVGAVNPVAEAEAQVDDTLSEFAGNYSRTATTGPCAGSSSVTCITVTVTYDYKNHPVVPSAPGLGVVLPNTFTSKSVVQL